MFPVRPPGPRLGVGSGDETPPNPPFPFNPRYPLTGASMTAPRVVVGSGEATFAAPRVTAVGSRETAIRPPFSPPTSSASVRPLNSRQVIVGSGEKTGVHPPQK